MREALKYIRNKYSYDYGDKTKLLIGAEIGVRDGDHALEILTSLNIRHLFLVDNFKAYQDGRVYRDDVQQREHYRNMFEKLMPYLHQVTFITRDSAFASTLFPDEFFDFAYIDGAHDYESVRTDLKCWHPKVKPYGVLCGHDYSSSGFPGVANAVNEFIKEHQMHFADLGKTVDWVVEKKFVEAGK